MLLNEIAKSIKGVGEMFIVVFFLGGDRANSRIPWNILSHPDIIAKMHQA